METVKVDKHALLGTLKANREKHIEAYNEAKANYRQKVVDQMRGRADDIENGGDIDIMFLLPKPENHADDYDEAIVALEWHEGPAVELDRRGEFQAWVLDKWHWERAFVANTMSYTGAASRR